MFTADYKSLILSFNKFHLVEANHMPQYGEFCLLELKNGDYTAGEWNPDDYRSKKSTSGEFIRGTADTIGSDKVERWHSLERYNLTECLEDEEIGLINLGPQEEGCRNIQFDGFKSFADRKNPKEEQYCLLIMKNGTLSAGRWNKWRHEAGGAFMKNSLTAI